MKKILITESKFRSLGVEPGVLHAVVALNALGFPTSGSCEGHSEESPYPWILFVTKQKKKSDKLDFNAWGKKTGKFIQSLEILLSGFYADRDVPLDQKLVVQYELNVTPFAFFKLQCAGAETLSLLPSEIFGSKARASILARHQKEMKDFAVFLKKHWKRNPR